MTQSIWMLLCFSYLAPTPSGELSVRPETLRETIGSIVKGEDNKARRAVIVARIKAMGLTPDLVPFSRKNYQGQMTEGVNILVSLTGSSEKSLLLGAHYDRVSVGAGAVDNAAACAVLLELVRILKDRPLENRNVTVAFWDQEEVGLVGSGAYVEANKSSLPDLYLNFDVFAYGEALWVMSPVQDGRAANAIRKAAKDATFFLEMGSVYPPSDHLVFIEAKVETLSISLAGKEEIAEVLKILKEKKAIEPLPKVLTIIHTENDTVDKVDPVAMARALPVIEQAVRLLDGENE